MKTINLEEILKSYLTLEAVRANKPDYTYNMVLSAMKEACRQTIELSIDKIKERKLRDGNTEFFVQDKQSILDTINQII